MNCTTLYCVRSKQRSRAATATVKADTGMLDDDDDVPLLDEKARAKHAASLHATGMSDDDDDVP